MTSDVCPKCGDSYLSISTFEHAKNGTRVEIYVHERDGPFVRESCTHSTDEPFDG